MLVAGLLHDYHPRLPSQPPQVAETLKVLESESRPAAITKAFSALNLDGDRVKYFIRATDFPMRPATQEAMAEYLKTSSRARRMAHNAAKTLALIDKAATYIHPQLSVEDVRKRIEGLGLEIGDKNILEKTPQFFRQYLGSDLNRLLKILPQDYKRRGCWCKIILPPRPTPVKSLKETSSPIGLKEAPQKLLDEFIGARREIASSCLPLRRKNWKLFLTF